MWRTMPTHFCDKNDRDRQDNDNNDRDRQDNKDVNGDAAHEVMEVDGGHRGTLTGPCDCRPFMCR
jgi:hypothetical protein